MASCVPDYTASVEEAGTDGWSIDRIIDKIKNGTIRRILTLSGAGISVSAGVPDFRSPEGLFSRIKAAGIKNPEELFHISSFREDPTIFYKFIREILPGHYTPTTSHLFIRLLERKGLLLRHYTQNIDTLERLTGMSPSKLVEAHGSFGDFHCSDCGAHYPLQVLQKACQVDDPTPYIQCERLIGSRLDLDPTWKSKRLTRSQSRMADGSCSIERDPPEPCRGYLKPSIVMYGEKLPDRFHRLAAHDAEKADLIIIMGTSLKVSPISSLIGLVGKDVPRLLINKIPSGIWSPDAYAHYRSYHRIRMRDDLSAQQKNTLGRMESSDENDGEDSDGFVTGDDGFRFYEPDNRRDLFLCGNANDYVHRLCKKLEWNEDLKQLRDECLLIDPFEILVADQLKAAEKRQKKRKQRRSHGKHELKIISARRNRLTNINDDHDLGPGAWSPSSSSSCSSCPSYSEEEQ